MPEFTLNGAHYDVIVIGGGHNGWSTPAYIRQVRPQSGRQKKKKLREAKTGHFTETGDSAQVSGHSRSRFLHF